MRRDPNEAKKVGEVVLFSIDKISDMEKSEIIAKIFIAYIKDYISFTSLRRMIEAVNQAFIDDLKAFINNMDNFISKSQEPYLRYLVNTGLTEVVAAKTFNEAGELYFEITKFGHEFMKAYQYASMFIK